MRQVGEVADPFIQVIMDGNRAREAGVMMNGMLNDNRTRRIENQEVTETVGDNNLTDKKVTRLEGSTQETVIHIMRLAIRVVRVAVM